MKNSHSKNNGWDVPVWFVRFVNTIGREALARRCRCTRPMISHWVRGRKRPCPSKTKLLSTIAQESGLVFKSWVIHPDVFDKPTSKNAA